ncbi:MAG: alkaline phosphatase family protein [Candidatus Sulfotelmatobacter sp.]
MKFWPFVYCASLCALCGLLVGCQGLGTPTPVSSYPLAVTASPATGGTITSSPAGISCPGTCTASFPQNMQVTLSATPGTNDLFGGWSGACSGSSTCKLTMTAAETVTATFAAGATLTVTTAGTGTGKVTSSPAGISCPGTCTAKFALNTQVTLTEAPGATYYFGGWSGACSGTTTCSVTMKAAENVAAAFSPAGVLTITESGNGTGTVTSSPAGINCPGTCTATFPPSTQVTLSETPGANYYFGGWSGACSGMATCSVSMTVPESVVAAFTSGDVLTVTTSGSGAGTVTSSPAGINCTTGSTTGCTAAFPPNTAVTLNETTTPPNVFSGWSGACTGTAGCNLTLTAPTNAVTATFAPGGTLQSLNHIIFFAQENRSFDSYFGYMQQYWVNQGIANQTFNGLPQFTPPANPLLTPTNPACDPSNPDGPTVCVPDPNVPPVPSFHIQSVCTEELSPFWNEAHTDWNYAFNFPNTIDWLGNGFVEAGANDARQYPKNYPPVNDVDGYRTMGYFTDADLNYYYFMASDFATSDSWFSPIMSRTQLNRAYILAATSDGYAYPPGSNSDDNAPFSSPTIFQSLQTAGITWRVYVDPDGTNCSGDTGSELNQCLANISYVNMFTFESQVQTTPSLYQNFVPISQFTTDAQNGTLAQVSLIEPASNAGLDEHPSDSDAYPENIQTGAKFAAGLINTLMTSPSWKDSAMIFTYDEAGGFYDHVQPQPVPVPDPNSQQYPIDLQPNDACDGADQTTGICSFGMTGYRVPLIVISPFAKKNFVSHVVRDSTAWLNLVEERFNVPALTARDGYWSTAGATMDEFFDFVNVPWATPPTPPTQNTNGTCSLVAPTP